MIIANQFTNGIRLRHRSMHVSPFAVQLIDWLNHKFRIAGNHCIIYGQRVYIVASNFSGCIIYSLNIEQFIIDHKVRGGSLKLAVSASNLLQSSA